MGRSIGSLEVCVGGIFEGGDVQRLGPVGGFLVENGFCENFETNEKTGWNGRVFRMERVSLMKFGTVLLEDDDRLLCL